MPATAAQIAFITQGFRIVKNGPDSGVVAKYGDDARRNEDPVETYFEAQTDAQSICDARKTLLSADRRRFSVAITGESTGLAMTYTSTNPNVTLIDDERLVNMAALVSEISINFGNEQTVVEIWG